MAVMPNRVQLVQQIRFALNNLGASNSHHAFEELCREVARQMVTPNVLPATGPVSAGGDQGRDFETLRTRLAPRLGDTGILLGLDGTELIAFACTLQQSAIETKIRRDVAEICGAGEPVAAVIVYCEKDIPVARRHTLQSWARQRWHMQLDIVDGHSLAEQLADPSLFWAATQFLSIPAEVGPEDDEPSRYGQNLQRWRARADDPQTLGDFASLREGLRDATFEAEHRLDLPFWLSRMRVLVGSPTEALARRARYEVIVATLRGLGHLRAAADADLVRVLLSNAEESTDPTALDDAGVVLMYCIGAWLRTLIHIDSDELMEWNARLRQRVESLLAGAIHEGTRCVLLDVLGSLRAQPDIRGVAASPGPVPVNMDELRERMTDYPRGHHAEPGARVPLVDLNGAVHAWLELARLLDRNWLYPVDTLADMVTFLAPLLSETAEYQELVDLLDAAVERISGKGAVAARCRDRALAHYRIGRVRDALTEFHRARVEWLGGDTLRGSLLAQLFVGDCYLALNLPDAARYFWLACAHLATRSPDLADLVPPALFQAADADYKSGAWFGSLRRFELAFRAQAALISDPWDPTRYDYLNHGVLDLMIIDACALRVGEPARSAAADAIDHVGIREVLVEAMGVNPWWQDLSTTELGQRVTAELGWPGFRDAGPNRTIDWNALGVRWSIRVANVPNSVIAAERVAAVMQVIAAELSKHELLIAPTDVRLEVLTRDASSRRRRPERLPSNEGRSWRAWVLGATSDDHGNEAFAEALDVMFDVLSDVSLLSLDDLTPLLDAAISEGMVERFAPMLLYDNLISVQGQTAWVWPQELGSRMPPEDFVAPEHPDLAWPTSLGPGYDQAASHEMVVSRYARMRELLPHSIPELMNDEHVQAVCAGLRERGWKDWHVLQALTNLIFSYRLSVLELRRPSEIQEAGQRLAQEPERSDAPRLPADSVTLESMTSALWGSMLVTIRNWPLELHQPTPDFAALERLLGERYRFWQDDVAHEVWWQN